MHRIDLLRHAKSSWENEGLPDRDRPLAPRGIRAAASLSEHFRALRLAPGLVLCSSARRATQTWEGVRGGLPPETAVEIEKGLYAATATALLDRLGRLPEAVRSVLIIGHNPAIEDLAIGLATDGDTRALQRIRRKYPTGALASLVFEGPWAKLSWSQARLEAFVVPRELG